MCTVHVSIWDVLCIYIVCTKTITTSYWYREGEEGDVLQESTTGHQDDIINLEQRYKGVLQIAIP